MKNLLFLFFLLITLGFSCPDIEEEALSIVEGNVVNCNAEPNTGPILIFAHTNFEAVLVDSIYPDSDGFFRHQFTSIRNVVYAVPGDFLCSSASASPEYGHISSVSLKQKTMFSALDLSIQIDPLKADSFHLQIKRIGDDVFYDNLSFDSGITNNWDTLQKVYRLCQGCEYLLISTIQPSSTGAIQQRDTLRIQDQLISRTIIF